MTLFEQLQRLRDETDPRESVWIRRLGSRIVVNDSDRGIELCGDDSDEVLRVILTDIGESEFALSDFT